MFTSHFHRKKEKAEQALAKIAEYVCYKTISNTEVYNTARLCLADSLGCALLALNNPACTKLLGPIVPGTIVPNGARVPGTDYILDPINAAFNIGTMIRWLDFNDTFLAEEWGHPSDNLGGLLAVGDWLSRKQINESRKPLTIHDLFTAMIKAYEIQGVLALKNSFHSLGFDHVILVKVATAAVVTNLLGGSLEQVIDVLSQAWIDGGPLRTYRHEPNVGSRKSWAAGDATSRGVSLALMTLKGEAGYPFAMSANRWGFDDVILKGHSLILEQPFGSYIMENILFKVLYPAEFHGQTAIEAALQLHKQLNGQIDEVACVEIMTQEPAMKIINKEGVLNNAADRDHCLQYMVAVALIKGSLSASDYEEEMASNPAIDALRAKMIVKENPQYSIDYLDPDKRSIANSVTVIFHDGRTLGPVEIEYPLGHRRRRQEAENLIFDKFVNNIKTRLSPERIDMIHKLFLNQSHLEEFPIFALIDLFFVA